MAETNIARAVRIGAAAAEYAAAVEAQVRELPIAVNAERMADARAVIEAAYRAGAEEEAARG